VAAPTGLRAVLRDALGGAMKDRDQIAVAAFRSALGVVDNAEAVDLAQAPIARPGTIAGGVVGLGAGEVPRRELSEEQLVARLRAEVADWEAAAADYQRHGRSDSAMRLYAEAEILNDLLDLLEAAGPA